MSRFRREALAAARLVHPNIVQVFDFGLDEATARNFIVMEFVDGESCAEILRDHGPLGTREAVNVLSQACRGLDYAHRNGVVHRDVKPGNLLRSRDNAVKLADFGIAKAAEQSDITKAGSVLGTAAYLSPEQARGEPAGPASRPVRARRRLLPAARRPPALRGGVADRPRAAAGHRAAAAPGRAQPRRPAARWRRRSWSRCTATRSAATPTPPTWSRRWSTALQGRAPARDTETHMGDGRHGGHAHAGRHAGDHRAAAARAPAPPARADHEEPAPPPPARASPRRPARRRVGARRRAASGGSGMKMWLGLLLVLALDRRRPRGLPGRAGHRPAGRAAQARRAGPGAGRGGRGQGPDRGQHPLMSTDRPRADRLRARALPVGRPTTASRSRAAGSACAAAASCGPC